MALTKATTTRPAGIALLSAAGLFLEIGLTRLFSTLFYPPYVFAILSLAVLGIGLGAAAATWRNSLRRDRHVPAYMALAGVAALVLVVFAVATASLSVQIPLFVLVVLPYVCVGLALATLFGNAAADSPRLYLADLVGAGLGALLVVPALNALGGIDGLLLAAALFPLAGVVVGWPRPGIPAVVFALTLIALGANLAWGWLAVDMAALATEKPITESLTPEGEVVATRWDAFARTDLIDPGDGGPYRLYMDGAAGSVMPPAGAGSELWRDVGFFPFATEQPQRVFVIGPGGGLDVWFGLESGAEEIVAVEVNPASVDLVREFAPYNGDLYGQPPVRVEVDEGRSVLRRDAATYDLIFLSQVVTLAAERSGYALVENSTFTVEAFRDYLDHLAPAGQIAIKLYDEPTLTRALATALAVFREQGLTDAEGLQHTVALLDANADPPIPLLLVRNAPFTRQDSLSLGAVAQEVGFVPLFLPQVRADPPLDAVAAGETTFSTIVAEAESDYSATTDDRPFFYQFERGVPAALQPLLWGLAAVIGVGALLLVVGQRGVKPAPVRWAPLYFAALGAGFIVVEVAVIQQTRLFLGHPTLAVTTVLATLLVGGGIGSGVVGRRLHGFAAWPPAGVALIGLLWLVAWPWLGQQFLAAATAVRVLVVVVSLLPLALLMGVPFPVGLRAVGPAGGRHVALAWAVNGVMTVAGSAGAVTLAILAGFSRVLLAGIAAYAVAALLALLFRNGFRSKERYIQSIL